MVGNLLDLQPNKVSIDLTQYSIVIMGDTGIGKTTTLMKFLKELSPDKEPFFLEFEDRYQNIPGIMAVKINNMSDFKSIIGQLRNPALKEKFSCIIIDTLDKYEEFCERYVLENRDAEILKDVGAYGEGSLRFKSALRNIGVIQSIGYPVHYIAQSSYSKDFDTKKESNSLKLNKNTFSYCREAAYLVGYMYAENNERFITFKKTDKYPDLKDTFGLPDKVNVKELKSIWTKSVESLGGEYVTKEKTIDKTIVEEDFEKIKSKGIELGGLLASNGRLDEATAILQKNLGIDDNGNVKMFDSLRESQLELTKVIVMELEELANKYNLLK
ncbi:ATP-binding protein [Anaerocolumna aminovalerica]|uniref:AAA family ATPase n=1 Tax=Anaerocolumna aminovalerica TaxID=1527 RepID=UPI001C0E92E7|nr:AAA family ATPase [Anaerocolumna aminovalerica]MBU5331721.1 ATP-binding protein [Anaerocolumna aminovalerica]